MNGSIRAKLILSVGTQKEKRPLSPVEVAEAIFALKRGGMTSEQIREMLYLENATMLGRFLALLRLDAKVRHLVDWGGRSIEGISFSAGAEIAKLGQEEHEPVANAVLEHGLTGPEVQQIVQIRRRSGRPVADSIAEVVGSRKQVERRYVFIGGVDLGIIKQINELGQVKADALLARALKNGVPAKGRLRGRLGKDKFTLVGDETSAAQLNTLPEGFEETINQWLSQELESND